MLVDGGASTRLVLAVPIPQWIWICCVKSRNLPMILQRYAALHGNRVTPFDSARHLLLSSETTNTAASHGTPTVSPVVSRIHCSAGRRLFLRAPSGREHAAHDWNGPPCVEVPAMREARLDQQVGWLGRLLKTGRSRFLGGIRRSFLWPIYSLAGVFE
jgi:hypothetical protein